MSKAKKRRILTDEELLGEILILRERRDKFRIRRTEKERALYRELGKRVQIEMGQKERDIRTALAKLETRYNTRQRRRRLIAE